MNPIRSSRQEKTLIKRAGDPSEGGKGYITGHASREYTLTAQAEEVWRERAESFCRRLKTQGQGAVVGRDLKNLKKRTPGWS